MRLLLVGSSSGELAAASEIATQRGAEVMQSDNVDGSLAALRARGADLIMIDVGQPIARLIEALEAECIPTPVLACGTDAGVAVAAAQAGARHSIRLPPDAELIAAVLEAAAQGAPVPSPGSEPESRDLQAAEAVTRGLVGRTVADVERDLILETLDHCLGNRTHAAKILGISIRTLRNKLNEYGMAGIPVPEPGQCRAVAV